jgi:gamma-glutamyl-gamma-aminobutyrate hydrolase PuuD
MKKIASALFYSRHWDNMVGVDRPDELSSKKHKLLVLHGGEDISPSLYKEEPGRTHAKAAPSRRDKEEILLVRKAVEEGIPILGICRGAQLLCALGGGALYQHVDNHHSTHSLVVNGKEYVTNSCHHQMMIPTDRMNVLGYTPSLSLFKWRDGDFPIKDEGDEPEIVHIPEFKALGVQGHPEWLPHDHDLNKITRHFLQELLDVQVSWS